jgi:hypothetical protein
MPFNPRYRIPLMQISTCKPPRLPTRSRSSPPTSRSTPTAATKFPVTSDQPRRRLTLFLVSFFLSSLAADFCSPNILLASSLSVTFCLWISFVTVATSFWTSGIVGRHFVGLLQALERRVQVVLRLVHLQALD